MTAAEMQRGLFLKPPSLLPQLFPQPQLGRAAVQARAHGGKFRWPRHHGHGGIRAGKHPPQPSCPAPSHLPRASRPHLSLSSPLSRPVPSPRLALSSPSPPVTLGRSLPPPARGLPLFLRARGRTDLQGAVRTLPGHPAHREPRGSALEKPCALPQRLLAARRRHDTAPPPFGSTDEPGPGPAPPARRCGGNLRALFCLLPFQREGGSSPVALLLLFPRDAPQPPHSSINGRLLSYMLTTG